MPSDPRSTDRSEQTCPRVRQLPRRRRGVASPRNWFHEPASICESQRLDRWHWLALGPQAQRGRARRRDRCQAAIVLSHVPGCDTFHLGRRRRLQNWRDRRRRDQATRFRMRRTERGPWRRWIQRWSRWMTVATHRCRSRSWRATSSVAVGAALDSSTSKARDSEEKPRTQRAAPSAHAVNSTERPLAASAKSASPIAASVALASEARAAPPVCLSRVGPAAGSRLRRGQSRCQWRPPQCRQSPAFSCHLDSTAARLGSAFDPDLASSLAVLRGRFCLNFDSASKARPLGRSSSRFR
eukprot:1118173-Pleurochrysis_carterae.AAC.1